MRSDGQTLAIAGAHLALGATFFALLFLASVETWVWMYVSDSDGIDTEIWWWWIPFCSSGLLVALLTNRERDRRRFWRAVPWLILAYIAVSISVPNRVY